MAPVTRFPWSPTTIGGVWCMAPFLCCIFLWPIFLVLCGLGSALTAESLFNDSIKSILSRCCPLTFLCPFVWWLWSIISRECDNSFLLPLEWYSSQHIYPRITVNTKNPTKTVMIIDFSLHFAMCKSFLLRYVIAWYQIEVDTFML